MSLVIETTPVPSWMYRIPRSRLFRYGQWLVIPALLFLGMEKRFKHWTIAREQGYVTAMDAPPHGHVDAVFIGISHVWAAIDSGVFDAQVSKASGHPFSSLNMGGGQRSLAMHYLGLRNLFQRYPEKFRGCTVFLEAPFDMPDKHTWHDPWYYPNAEMNVIRVLHEEDLSRMLANESGLSRKMLIYGLWMENHSSFVSYRKILRARFVSMCELSTLRAAQKTRLFQQEAESGPDVQAGGTMRTDALAIKIGHDTAIQAVAGELADQKPVQDWNATVLADLHRLALRNGVQLVLFKMPKHSMFAPPYKTAVRQRDATMLAAALVQWHVPLLKPDFSYTDDDFPDAWHLHRSLRDSYTKQLADAWLKSLYGPKPSE